MAITYPRVLPAGFGLRSQDFELVRFESVNTLEGIPSDAAPLQGMEIANPRWRGQFTTQALDRNGRALFRAWHRSLKGVMKTFLGYDFDRPFPGNYKNGFAGINRAGGGAFDGTADVTALTASTIALATLPAAFALKAGDYIGLTEGTKRALHSILEDITANGSGAVTVTVEPPVLTNIFTAAAVANFDKPTAEMIVVPGTFSCPSEARRDTSASWAGVQKLN